MKVKKIVTLAGTKKIKLQMRHIMLIGIFVRIVLSLYTQHAATWAKILHLDELFLIGGNPLTRATSFGVGYYFFYAPMYEIYYILSTYFSISYEFLLNVLFRIPTMIGDIIMAYALYMIAFKITKKKTTAVSLAAIFFLNPYVIWVSAIVGHAESLMMAFVVLSMFFMIDGNGKMSALSLAFATAFRHLPLLLFPFFLYYSIRNKISPIRYLLVYFLGSFLLAIPYLISIIQMNSISFNYVVAFFQHWIGSGSAVQGVGNYGIESIIGWTYNFTGIFASLGLWENISPFMGFRNFLSVLVPISIIIVILRRDKLKMQVLNSYSAFVFCLLLIFTPLVQHHYLLWAFPFILLSAYVFKDIPKFIPHMLALTSLLIDPIIEGSFYYYTLSTWPVAASQLQDAWVLRDLSFQLSISGLHALLTVLVIILTFLTLLKIGLGNKNDK